MPGLHVLAADLAKWDEADRDALVLPIFADERPLRGAAGLCDWRLNGRLSRLVRAKRATGTRDFTTALVQGMREHQTEIDALIGKASRNWRLERMARVDRNLLRLAVYELKYCEDVPAKVAINEAIEIAKRYGTAESPAFVNGILDRCLEEVGR